MPLMLLWLLVRLCPQRPLIKWQEHFGLAVTREGVTLNFDGPALSLLAAAGDEVHESIRCSDGPADLLMLHQGGLCYTLILLSSMVALEGSQDVCLI